MARYFAIVRDGYIQKDVDTGQLEIYEDMHDAVMASRWLEVKEVFVSAKEVPDVSELVEALERVMYCNEVKFLPEDVQQSVSDALAAHRKGDE